jgi:hypothetical protein
MKTKKIDKYVEIYNHEVKNDAIVEINDIIGELLDEGYSNIRFGKMWAMGKEFISFSGSRLETIDEANCREFRKMHTDYIKNKRNENKD